MKIIMNERKRAEEYLESGEVTNIVQCVYILARYFKETAITDDEIYELIDNFLTKSVIGYRSDNWKSTIEFQIKKTKNHKLIEIDSISITQKEIDAINALHNRRLERTAFSLLVVAKYYNCINLNNNNWTNKDMKDIFSLANVNVVKEKQCSILNAIKEKNLITLSAKVDSLNMNVQFVDDGDTIYEVKDIEDLGLQYDFYIKKDTTFKKCKRCGKIIKKTKKQYCKNCAIISKREAQKEYIRNKRAEKNAEKSNKTNSVENFNEN